VEALLSGQLLLAALVTGFLYALVALGLNLIYGTMRLLNVAHGELVMLGGYVVYWLVVLWDVPPPVGAAAAAAMGAALGWAAYRGIFRGAIAATRAIEQLEANSLLLFFGLMIIVQNVATLAFTGDFRGYRYLDHVVEIAGLRISGNRLYVFVAAALICLGTAVLLRATTLGLSVRALIQNRDAARLVGIDVDRVQLASFALGFGMAALAGALISAIEQVSPSMGFPFTIAAFVVIILGGLGNLTGSLVGGMVLGVLETYGVALTAPTYQSILIYGVFIVVLLWRPQGLFGARARAR
jgi:branched-chain amino acid transport system permease protein